MRAALTWEETAEYAEVAEDCSHAVQLRDPENLIVYASVEIVRRSSLFRQKKFSEVLRDLRDLRVLRVSHCSRKHDGATYSPRTELPPDKQIPRFAGMTDRVLAQQPGCLTDGDP